MKWFGQSWSAPINAWENWVETPAGRVCPECGEKIVPHDRGVIVPHANRLIVEETHMTPVLFEERAFHLECWLPLVIGPDAAEGLNLKGGR